MDLETENRIAAILLKESNELRRQAQNEGALAYLRQPTVRARPNSRFLTATVRGVQQANRAVEVNEMWRLRDKQLELDNRLKGMRNGSSHSRNYTKGSESNSRCRDAEPSETPSHSSKKRTMNEIHSVEDEGLRDDEMEEFLRSRATRGRGAVGSRMDDVGPYLPSSPGCRRNEWELDEERTKTRVLLGPEKPSSIKYSESSDDEYERKKKKPKVRSTKKHSSKHSSKEKSRDKKRRRG